MPQARDALAALDQRLVQLAALLEAIQSEHTDEARWSPSGRLEREVQPLTAAVHKRPRRPHARPTTSRTA